MAAVTKSPLLVAFWKFHRFVLRASKGRLLTQVGPGRQLLLVTRGRKTGEARPVVLSYMQDGDRFVVVASNTGLDQHPAWWLNLLADPAATVEVGGTSRPVMAREIEEPERSEVLSRFITATDASYVEYQRRTSRRLPVVALTPTTL